MATCKTCEKQFHACSNCGLFHSWEYEYCCEECWRKSEAYVAYKTVVTSFYSMLSPIMRDMFKKISSGYESDFEFEIEEWIQVIDGFQEQVDKGSWEISKAEKSSE